MGIFTTFYIYKAGLIGPDKPINLKNIMQCRGNYYCLIADQEIICKDPLSHLKNFSLDIDIIISHICGIDELNRTLDFLFKDHPIPEEYKNLEYKWYFDIDSFTTYDFNENQIPLETLNKKNNNILINGIQNLQRETCIEIFKNDHNLKKNIRNLLEVIELGDIKENELINMNHEQRNKFLLELKEKINKSIDILIIN